jgi:hypothetical protein
MNPAAETARVHLENEEENTDINLLTHRIIRQGDLITIRKDGTILLNEKVQDEYQMELM